MQRHIWKFIKTDDKKIWNLLHAAYDTDTSVSDVKQFNVHSHFVQ